MSIMKMTIARDKNGVLSLIPGQVFAGHRQDNLAHVLTFERPEEFTTAQLNLYLNGGQVLLGNADSFPLPNSITSQGEVALSAEFLWEGSIIEQTNIVKLFFGLSQRSSFPAPGPLPQPIEALQSNAWYGAKMDMGTYWSIRNAHGQEIDQLPKGGGGEASKALWLPEVDAQGIISWTHTESEAPPLPRNIMGPRGTAGPQGPVGERGPQGPQGAAAPAMRVVRCRFAQQSVEARVEKTLAFNPDTIAGDAEMISVADGVFTAPKDGIYAYSSSSMRCSALAQVNVAIYTDTAGYTSARVAYARTEASSWGIASLSWTGFLAQGQFLRPVMWASIAQESIYEDNPGKNALAWVTFALLSEM